MAYAMFYISKERVSSLYSGSIIQTNVLEKDIEQNKSILDFINKIPSTGTISKTILELYVQEGDSLLCEIKHDKPIYGNLTLDEYGYKYFKVRRTKNFSVKNESNYQSPYNDPKVRYKAKRYYSIPVNFSITTKDYKEYKNTCVLNYISLKYFNNEPLYAILNKDCTTTHLTEPVEKLFTQNKTKERRYIVSGLSYFVRESDLVEYKINKRINKKREATIKLLDSVFKPILQDILDTNNIKKINKDEDVEYIWDTNALYKIIEKYFLEKVMPELEKAGITINKRTKNTFLKTTNSKIVLFRNKNLNITNI